MNQRADIDKIYLYAKDTYEAKYLILVKNVKILNKAF